MNWNEFKSSDFVDSPQAQEPDTTRSTASMAHEVNQHLLNRVLEAERLLAFIQGACEQSKTSKEFGDWFGRAALPKIKKLLDLKP